MHKADCDRNLLFGILALQMDLISRDQLVAAMNTWVLDKEKPLGAILEEQKALDGDALRLLDALVQKHVALHGGAAEKSLATLSSADSLQRDLKQIADADVQESLAQVGRARQEEDPLATWSQSAGVPTSAGTRFRILRPRMR